MEMININGRSVPCGDYTDALDILQTTNSDNYDVYQYIGRNANEIVAEAERQLEILQGEYKELEEDYSGEWERGRNLVQEASTLAEEAIALLDASRLDKIKLRGILSDIAVMFDNNY